MNASPSSSKSKTVSTTKNNESTTEPQTTSKKKGSNKTSNTTKPAKSSTTKTSKPISVSTTIEPPKICTLCKKNKVAVGVGCNACRSNHYLCTPCYQNKENYNKDDQFMCYERKNACFDCGGNHKLSEPDTTTDECHLHTSIWCIKKKDCGNYNTCGQCEIDLGAKYNNTTYPPNDPKGRLITSYNNFKFYDEDDETICSIGKIKELEPTIISNDPPSNWQNRITTPMFYNKKNKRVSISSTPKKKKKNIYQLPTSNQLLKDRNDSLIESQMVCLSRFYYSINTYQSSHTCVCRIFLITKLLKKVIPLEATSTVF